jgi:hypothetical protein
MESTAPAAKASGLSTVVNTIAAPSDAFETIRVAPTWGWALVITIVLVTIAAFLEAPAVRHVQIVTTQHMLATSSYAANIPPDRKQKMLADAAHPSALARATALIGPAIGLFIAVLLNTLFLLIGNAVGRGQADFKRLWAASMNIAVPTVGLGAIVTAIIVMLRNPDSFNSSIDIAKAVPSLAWIMPNASTALLAFGAAISIFSLWGLFLNATTLRLTAKTSAGVAYTFAALITLLGAFFFSASAQALHNFGMG